MYFLLSSQAGTPYYTAPEMIAREPYSYPADCWSFGVIVHQLLALERPFDGNHTADLVKSILSNEPPPLPTHYSDEIK
jgi:serine/threonine protein kinase